jgi:hypothetical protein
MHARQFIHIAPHGSIDLMPLAAQLLRHRTPEARGNACYQYDHIRFD